MMYLFEAFPIVDAETCLRFRARYTLEGKSIFKAQIIGLEQKV